MFANSKVSIFLIGILLSLLLFSNHQNKELKDNIKTLENINKVQDLTIKELEAEITKNEQIIDDLKKIKPKKEIVLQRIKDEKMANDELSSFYVNFYECLQQQSANDICKAKDK